MNPTLKALLSDAAQFIAGILAGKFDRTRARRLAIAIASELGESDQMEKAISAAEVERAARQTGKCIFRLLDELSKLPREFAETARLREKAGDDSAALMGFSCAERMVELFREYQVDAPKYAGGVVAEATLPPILERLEDGTVRRVETGDVVKTHGPDSTERLEPNGGNLYRPHRLLVHSGQFWRCAHGLTGWTGEGLANFTGCPQCAEADPNAFQSWKDFMASEPEPDGYDVELVNTCAHCNAPIPATLRRPDDHPLICARCAREENPIPSNPGPVS